MQSPFTKDYFRLLDSVALETGNSKKELHNSWLIKIFPFLLEDESNFIEDFNGNYTTKILSEKGWKTMQYEFKHYCLDFFNVR